MFSFSVVLITIGEIMAASSKTISVYAGAQVFWAFGYIGISLMLQILAGGMWLAVHTFPLASITDNLDL